MRALWENVQSCYKSSETYEVCIAEALLRFINRQPEGFRHDQGHLADS